MTKSTTMKVNFLGSDHLIFLKTKQFLFTGCAFEHWLVKLRQKHTKIRNINTGCVLLCHWCNYSKWTVLGYPLQVLKIEKGTSWMISLCIIRERSHTTFNTKWTNYKVKDKQTNTAKLNSNWLVYNVGHYGEIKHSRSESHTCWMVRMVWVSVSISPSRWVNYVNT